MRYFLLMIAVVMGQSVLAADKKPLIADPIVEKAIYRIVAGNINGKLLPE